MTASFEGVRIVDVSTGPAGALATMLLADHGAEVLLVEAPEGNPLRDIPAWRVWARGKSGIGLDPSLAADRDRLVELIRHADVVVEGDDPGTLAHWGLGAEEIRRHDTRLITCSVPAYPAPVAGRPVHDGLVAARTGLYWDQRGYDGGPLAHASGRDDLAFPGVDVPAGSEQTGHRDGPIFLAYPWPSYGGALMATFGIACALFDRERSGRGRHVSTSLLQGAMWMSIMFWQRAERPGFPGYRNAFNDRRATKGLWECSDGMWFHQWSPIEHLWLQAAAAGDTLRAPAADLVRQPPFATDFEKMLVWQLKQYPLTAAAVRRFPRSEWIELLARHDIAAQPVRSPAEALTDSAIRDEGGIVDVVDPELGTLTQCGIVHRLDRAPAAVRGAAPRLGEHRDFAWDSLRAAVPASDARFEEEPRAPLAGIRVIDFGVAVAGPFGPQMLADLGADVIKVSAHGESLVNAFSIGCHRNKRNIGLDLKSPMSKEIIRRLFVDADVIHHNMRTGVAERLGIDIATARAINPQVIYCHTRGFEAQGPRTFLPGNDQMGHALAGSAYEAGAMHAGQPPVWQNAGAGDLGCGTLSAIGVVQALLLRTQTGEPSFVDTSILDACMLFNSHTFIDADGREPERRRIDAMQTGLGALERMYETSDGWLFVVATDDASRTALCVAVGRADLAGVGDDAALAAGLAAAIAGDTAEHWATRVEAAGVPCEVVSDTWLHSIWDDQRYVGANLVTHWQHPRLGRVDQPGDLVTVSGSPRTKFDAPPLVGQHSVELLAEIGFSNAEIGELLASGVVCEPAI